MPVRRRPSRTTLWRLSAVALAAASILLATGCASRAIPPTGEQSLVVQGGVNGGQQPIAGAQVYLYATHTGNTGTAISSLLPAPATTDSNGGFTLDPASYHCTSPNDQVFFVAAGGDPGSGSINNAITLVDLFGSCSNLNANSFVVVNEITTVAAAYALAPLFGNAFQYTGGSFSPGFTPGEFSHTTNSLTDASIVAQLFANAAALVNPQTGAATINAGTLVQQTLNTLGNITAACVNSANATSSTCNELLMDTWALQPNPPNDTFTALLYVAQAPDWIGGSLLSLAPPTPPFQPTLSVAPANWSLSDVYNNISGLNWSPF